MRDLNNTYYDSIRMDTNYAIDLIDYDGYTDLYPDFSYEYDDEGTYYFDSKDDAYSYVNQILSLFDSFSNPFPIFRTIKVNSLDDVDFDFLGESWTFEMSSALNFAKYNNGGNMILTANIFYDNVDWKETFKRYMEFSGGFTDSDENEIVVLDTDLLNDLDIDWIKDIKNGERQ